MKINKIAFFVVAFMALSLCLTGCSGSAMSSANFNSGNGGANNVTGTPERESADNEKTEIVVGRVAPFTGGLAAFAKGSPQVEEYAVSSINAVGGIEIDGKKLPIRFVMADSETDPTKASEAATKLIESEGVDVMIVSHTDRTTVPVAAACEKAGVVCLSVDTPAEAWLSGGPYQYSYHAGFNTENELACFFDAWELTETNKKVGLITSNDDAGLVISESIAGFTEGKGYTVVDPGKFTMGSNDYTSIIRALKDAQCDIIVGSMMTSDFSVFWNQCRENGYIPKVCTIAKATLFVEDVMAIGPNGEADGIVSEVWWTANHPFRSSLTKESSRELAQWWCATMNAGYAPATMGYKYANVEILVDVLTRAGSLDRDKILDAVAATSLDTCIGHVVYREDHVSVMPLVTGQWVWDDEAKTYRQNIVANTQVADVPVADTFRILGGS